MRKKEGLGHKKHQQEAELKGQSAEAGQHYKAALNSMLAIRDQWNEKITEDFVCCFTAYFNICKALQDPSLASEFSSLSEKCFVALNGKIDKLPASLLLDLYSVLKAISIDEYNSFDFSTEKNHEDLNFALRKIIKK